MFLQNLGKSNDHPLSFWRLDLVGGACSELFRQFALAPLGKEPSPRSVFTAQLVSSGTVSLVFWRIISIGGFSVDCACSELFTQSALAPFGRELSPRSIFAAY